MPTTAASIADIIVDCEDPERVAQFWADILERPIEGRRGPYVWLQRQAGIGLGFQHVAEPRAAKNRVHFDVATQDLKAAKARIESLGGCRLSQYDDGGFLVMADPEGNEFCLIPAEPFDLDVDGRTTYLERYEV